jgi:hypothetical protein
MGDQPIPLLPAIHKIEQNNKELASDVQADKRGTLQVCLPSW